MHEVLLGEVQETTLFELQEKYCVVWPGWGTERARGRRYNEWLRASNG